MTGQFPPDVITAARALYIKWGVPASCALAQWALESAWGKRTMGEACNPFGIKAVAGQASIGVSTHEVINGRSVRVVAQFCRFESIAEAFDGLGAFYHRNRRYAAALATHDGISFAKAIAKAGYATDPDYADKLVGLIKTYGLLQYDKPLITPRPAEPVAATPPVATTSATGQRPASPVSVQPQGFWARLWAAFRGKTAA